MTKYTRLIAWAALAMAVLPAACSQVASGEPKAVAFSVFGDPAEFQAYQSLVAAFEEAHDDIDIVLSHIPSQSDYRARLATDFAAGAPPDVSLHNFRRYASFAAEGVLEPLGPYLDESELIAAEDFYPITLKVFTWQDMLMCIPQNISSLVVYYNADLFDAAGVAYPADDWTWDDFLATAQALTLDTDGDGQTDQFGLGTDASFFRLAPFIWQNEGELVDDPARPTRLIVTRPPALAAFQWFVNLNQVHRVTPSRAEEAAQDSESRFIAGTTAMYLNSRRGTPTYREIKSFTWDIAPLPRGKTAAGILHSDAYCLSAEAPNRDAAWTFIEFANSAEGQAIVAASGRTVPSLIEVAESPAFLDPNEAPGRARVFLDTVDVLRAVPIISTWQDIEVTAGMEVERAFYGDISVDEAANLAVERTLEYFLIAQYAGR
ncbi:MAG: ABC transporter substrate-binding protein [Candidatus Promineifilaceae bacterium]